MDYCKKVAGSVGRALTARVPVMAVPEMDPATVDTSKYPVRCTASWNFNIPAGESLIIWAQPKSREPIGYLTVPAHFTDGIPQTPENWAWTTVGTANNPNTSDTLALQQLAFYNTCLLDNNDPNSSTNIGTSQYFYDYAGSIGWSQAPWEYLDQGLDECNMALVGGHFTARLVAEPLGTMNVASVSPADTNIYGPTQGDVTDEAFKKVTNQSPSIGFNKEIGALPRPRYNPKILQNMTQSVQYSPYETYYYNLFTPAIEGGYLLSAKNLWDQLRFDTHAGAQERIVTWDLHTKDRTYYPVTGGRINSGSITNPPADNTQCDGSLFPWYKSPAAPFINGQGILIVRNPSTSNVITVDVVLQATYVCSVGQQLSQILCQTGAYKALNEGSGEADDYPFHFQGSKSFKGSDSTPHVKAIESSLTREFPASARGVRGFLAKALAKYDPLKSSNRQAVVPQVQRTTSIDTPVNVKLQGSENSQQDRANDHAKASGLPAFLDIGGQDVPEEEADAGSGGFLDALADIGSALLF